MIKRQSLTSISPWLLAAACGLLAMILGVFALSNYKREKELMTESLIRQGLTIARFVTSSSIAYLRGSPRGMDPRLAQWREYLQLAIDNSSNQPGLVRVALANEDGTVLASSREEDIGEFVGDEILHLVRQLHDDSSEDELYVFQEMENESDELFQFAIHYNPLGRRGSMAGPRGRGGRFGMRHGGPERQFGRQFQDERALIGQLLLQRFYLIVEVDQSEFSESVNRQLVQIITLFLVLLLVGTGGWLSLLTLQGLRGSQKRLSRIRQFTDILVSSLPVGLVATDDKGKLRICNEVAERMLCLSVADILAKTPHEVLPPALADVFKENLNASHALQKETVLKLADGTERSLLLTAVPVVDDEGENAGSTLLLQDLSQIKKLQDEVRRNERLAALGKMAAGIAHELRNPLSSIKGLALLLKAKVKHDQKGVETVEVLVQEVERLNRSIGELLDYARPHTLSMEPLQIDKLLDKAIALLEADVHTGDVAVTKKYDTESLVYGDRDKLTQVFLNIFLNSIQSIEIGGNISIRLYQKDELVVCQIQDDGRGVDSNTAERVFDPYFTTKSTGTGLGLSMSRKIIEEHRGTIDFSSIEGSGTTVRIFLPAYSGGN